MNWETSEYTEIQMDAEINAYQDDFDTEENVEDALRRRQESQPF